MFNLINKTVQSVKELQKPIATVEEIHREFDSASEKILKEAYLILEKEFIQDKEELNKLEKLGFTKLNSVIEYNKKIKKITQAKKEVELINYYKRNYPNNKFINESELGRICKKYGLILGSTSDYIGDIPIKNRKEILNFSLKDERDYQYFYKDRFGDSHYISFEMYNNYSEDNNVYNVYYYTTGKITKLIIVATPNLFDLKNKVIHNYRITQKQKDPIVLHPVNGGYLIVSKWGNEENLNEFK